MYIAYSSFEELTQAASRYLENIGRSKQTVTIYNWIWRKIKVFMDDHCVINCTSSTIADYLNATYGSQSIAELTHHQKHCLRCAICLIQFAETNKMIEVINRREGIALSGEIGAQITSYIESKKALRLNDKTLKSYVFYLYQFLKHLNECEIYTCGSISPLIIMKYCSILLPEAAGAKHLALSNIKGFLRYLYEQNKTLRDLSLIVPRDNYKKQPRLPSTYTKEEVQLITTNRLK
jgi:hypothetical protein